MIYKFKADLIRIIDGDTMEFCLDLGLDVFMNEIVRLKDVNTPEIRGPQRRS